MRLKHMQKHKKTLEKQLQTYASSKYNNCNIFVKHMEHPDEHTCNIRLKKIDETLGTDTCNIRVQSLKHMQHPDLPLQHLHETFETYL
jgi:hypothetical protein